MSHEDQMNVGERRKYLHKMQQRYEQANRRERGALLDEMAAVTGLHRKSLVRLINRSLARKERCRQRERSYGPDVDDALRVIAEAYDDICAERLRPNLVTMAEHLARHGEVVLTAGLRDQFERISVSTLQRRLSHLRQDEPRLARRKPAVQPNPLLRQIPMERISWRIGQPGHFEADLVHHCGSSASGLYVCTVHIIDVATGWSDRAAVLGRGYLVMQDAFRYMLKRMPFPVLEVHPDNDSAFFNAHMLRFWGELAHGVRLSRSRPYHKNDNPFVEQGNSNKVRAYLGHERLDTVAQTCTLNHLYDRIWLYHNAFLPVMRVREKRAVPDPHGGPTHVQRIYDQARTPLERVGAAGVLEPHVREQLEALRDATNPRQLRQEIDDYVDYIASLPCAVPGQPENVYLTLRDHQLRELFEPETVLPEHRAR
jgi:hypothetical protein